MSEIHSSSGQQQRPACAGHDAGGAWCKCWWWCLLLWLYVIHAAATTTSGVGVGVLGFGNNIGVVDAVLIEDDTSRRKRRTTTTTKQKPPPPPHYSFHATSSGTAHPPPHASVGAGTDHNKKGIPHLLHAKCGISSEFNNNNNKKKKIRGDIGGGGGGAVASLNLRTDLTLHWRFLAREKENDALDSDKNGSTSNGTTSSTSTTTSAAVPMLLYEFEFVLKFQDTAWIGLGFTGVRDRGGHDVPGSVVAVADPFQPYYDQVGLYSLVQTKSRGSGTSSASTTNEEIKSIRYSPVSAREMLTSAHVLQDEEEDEDEDDSSGGRGGVYTRLQFQIDPPYSHELLGLRGGAGQHHRDGHRKTASTTTSSSSSFGVRSNNNHNNTVAHHSNNGEQEEDPFVVTMMYAVGQSNLVGHHRDRRVFRIKLDQCWNDNNNKMNGNDNNQEFTSNTTTKTTSTTATAPIQVDADNSNSNKTTTGTTSSPKATQPQQPHSHHRHRDGSRIALWLHGVLAFAAFGVLIPAAMLSAWFRRVLLPSTWIFMHAALHVVAWFVAVAAVCLAFAGMEIVVDNDKGKNDKSKQQQHMSRMHHWMGVALLALFTFQVLNGWLRPPLILQYSSSANYNDHGHHQRQPTTPSFSNKQNSNRRERWFWMHRIIAVTVLMMILYQIHSGIALYGYHQTSASSSTMTTTTASRATRTLHRLFWCYAIVLALVAASVRIYQSCYRRYHRNWGLYLWLYRNPSFRHHHGGGRRQRQQQQQHSQQAASDAIWKQVHVNLRHQEQGDRDAPGNLRNEDDDDDEGDDSQDERWEDDDDDDEEMRSFTKRSREEDPLRQPEQERRQQEQDPIVDDDDDYASKNPFKSTKGSIGFSHTTTGRSQQRNNHDYDSYKNNSSNKSSQKMTMENHFMS